MMEAVLYLLWLDLWAWPLPDALRGSTGPEDFEDKGHVYKKNSHHINCRLILRCSIFKQNEKCVSSTAVCSTS